MNLQEQEDFMKEKLENFNTLSENEKANLVLCCVAGVNIFYKNGSEEEK